MKEIRKYDLLMGCLFHGGTARFMMPNGARVLSVQMNDSQATLWVLCDPEAPREKRFFVVRGANQVFGEAVTNSPATSPRFDYIGSIQDGARVWHIFESALNLPETGKENPDAVDQPKAPPGVVTNTQSELLKLAKSLESAVSFGRSGELCTIVIDAVVTLEKIANQQSSLLGPVALQNLARRLEDAVTFSKDKDLGPLAMEAVGALRTIDDHRSCGCCCYCPPLYSITVEETPAQIVAPRPGPMPAGSG